jgi:hypothetical protein
MKDEQILMRVHAVYLRELMQRPPGLLFLVNPNLALTLAICDPNKTRTLYGESFAVLRHKTLKKESSLFL